MDLKGCQAPFFLGKIPQGTHELIQKMKGTESLFGSRNKRSPRKQSKAATPAGKPREFQENTEKRAWNPRQTEGSGIFPKFGGNTGIKEPLATPGWQRLAPAWPCRNPAGIREPPSRTLAHSRQFLVRPSRRRSVVGRPHEGAQHSLPFPEPHPSGMGSCHP